MGTPWETPESAEAAKVCDIQECYQLFIINGKLDFPTSPIAPSYSHRHSTDTIENNRVIEGSETPLPNNVWLQHNHPLEDSAVGWVLV